MMTSTEKYNLLAHKTEFGLTEKQLEIVLKSADKTIAEQIHGSDAADEIFGQRVTDEILYNGNTDVEAVKKQFMEHGYSEHDAAKAAFIREQQRRDTQKVMTKIASAVRKNGGSLGMDAKSGAVWIDANGKRTVLDRLPQNVMENGMSFVQSGNMRFHAPVGLYATNIYAVENGKADKLEYKFMSKIGAEFSNMGYLYSSIKRAADRGQIGEGVQDFISALANRVSQSASVLTEDFAEMRMGGNVDIGGILPLIAREDVWNELSSKIDFDDPYSGEGNRALRAAVEKIQKGYSPTLPDDYKAFSADVGITTAIRDIMPALHKYLGADSQGMMRNILGDNYEDFSVYTKAAGKGMINVYGDMHQFGGNLTSEKRKTEDFIGRANKFYTDGEALDGKIQGVEFGHAINTAVGRKYEEDAGEGVGNNVSDVLRTKRIRMTTGTLKEIAANADVSQETRDMLFGSHLTEGAAIVDPRLIDAFWDRSKAMQRIRDARVLDIVEDELDHLNEKNKMATKIKINEDGTIGFKYSKGLFVETTELAGKSPLTVKGIGDKGSQVDIKERGLMRLGYFSRKNNLLVGEEDIRALLNRQDNASRITQAQNAAAEAARILNEHFEAYYYNTGIEANSNIKLEEAREKGMHNALFGYLGSGGRTEAEKTEDKRLAKALRNLGAGELMHFVPHKDLIESLRSDDIASTAFGVYLEGVTGKKRTHQQIIEVMANALRLNEGEAADAGKKIYDIAMRERYTPWDETMSAVQGSMGLSDAEMREIHSISNFVSNGVTKHKDVPTNVAVNLLARGFSTEKVVEILQPAIGNMQIAKGKDGAEVLVADPGSINIDALQRIAKKYGLEDTRKFWSGEGRLIDEAAYLALPENQKALYRENSVSVSATELAQGDDFNRARTSDAMRGKTWKYDYRSQAMSDIDRYSEGHLKNIQAGLIKALGDKEGSRVFQEHFDNDKIGARTGEGFFQDLERSHWYTPGEQRVLIHGDLDQSLLTAKEVAEIDEARGELRKAGIKDEFVNAVIKAAKDGYENGGERVAGSNADYVSIDKVKAHYSLNQHQLAANFNNGTMTMEEISKGGFNGGNAPVITMNELFTPNSNFQDVEGHLYGKSAFLDLHIAQLGNKQIYKDESQRYVALPWTDQRILEEDGDVLKNLYQKRVSSMLKTVQKIQSGEDDDGAPLKAEQIQALRDKLAEHADELKQSVVQNAMDKNGIVHRQLGTSYLGMSAFNKAYGIELSGKETGFWGNIAFDGRKIAGLAEKGDAVIDFQVASEMARRRFYDSSYFEQLGLSGNDLKKFKHDVFDRLETSGTLSTNSRNPQGYDKSTSAAAMYFSKTVKGNMLAVSAAMWESKKGDYDSDEAISHILTGDVVVTKDGKKSVAKIDYATYEQLQEMAKTGEGGITNVAASSHAQSMWADAKAQIWSQAVTRNRLADQNVREREEATGDISTHVTPENDFGYMYDETVEGNGKYYKGDRHVVAGSKYHGLSSTQRSELRGQHEGFMKAARKWQGISDDAFTGMSDAEQRDLYAGYVSEKLGENTSQGIAARDALGFITTERREMQDAVAMKRNAAAGQMNNAVFRLFRVADASGQFNEDDGIRGIGAIHTALNEAFLSPKNETGIAGVEDINRLTTAANNVYKLIVQAHPSKRQVREADMELENIAYEVLKSRGFKELKRYVPGFEEQMAAGGEEYARNYVHKTFGSIGSKVNAAGFDMKTFDIGMRSNLASYSNSLQVAYGGLQNSHMNDVVLQEAASINAEYGKGISILKQNAPLGGGSKDYQQTIGPGANYESNLKQYESAFRDEADSPLRESSHAKPPTLGDLGRDATKALSNIKISNSAALKAGAAIVGGLMASGYAGGVKTTPPSATTQAAGANEALQEAQVPNLSDSNVNVLRGGPQSGYVINIAASSPQGSDAARNAIAQALGSSVPVNMSMNISMNTNYQDQVNQLQISRILGNML